MQQTLYFAEKGKLKYMGLYLSLFVRKKLCTVVGLELYTSLNSEEPQSTKKIHVEKSLQKNVSSGVNFNKFRSSRKRMSASRMHTVRSKETQRDVRKRIIPCVIKSCKVGSKSKSITISLASNQSNAIPIRAIFCS